MGEKNKEKLTVLILTGILVLIICISIFKLFSVKNDSKRVVHVISCGEEIYTYRLDSIKKENIIRINSGDSGHYNIVSITAEGAQVMQSDCKGSDCVNMGKISHSGETICCLPNRLLITITSDKPENDTDAITY